MGVSPWMDLGTLWREKTGRAGARGSNYAMRRGQQLEPEARELYIRTTGVRVEPVCLEHSDHGWMRGSLDGLSADGRTVLEIKCPGEADHGTALARKVPEKYVPQLQHLLMVSGAEVCHYFSYRHGAGTLIEVRPDPAYLRRLVEREHDFWRHVLEDRCPQPSLFDG
jgi:putative phage-type endonuclease